MKKLLKRADTQMQQACDELKGKLKSELELSHLSVIALGAIAATVDTNSDLTFYSRALQELIEDELADRDYWYTRIYEGGIFRCVIQVRSEGVKSTRIAHEFFPYARNKDLRDKVFKAIEGHPGITVRQISERLGRGGATVENMTIAHQVTAKLTKAEKLILWDRGFATAPPF